MKNRILSVLLLLFTIAGFAKNKTWICINENGATVFTIEAIYVSEFRNGLAAVYKNTLVNNKWITGNGFVDRTGKVVVPCDLDKVKNFDANVTWIKRKGESFYRLIDKTGREIPTDNYEKVGSFFGDKNPRSAVYKEGKMGFIDESGKLVIPCKYIGSTAFTEGLASVCLATSVKGEYGFINPNGEVVIPLKFVQSGTSSFSGGLARASVAGKTVLIDKTGEIVFKTSKGNIQGQRFGLISVITKPNRKGWGWVNFKDEFVIDPVYDYAMNFNEDGYAVVEKNGLKGVIDTTGKTVLPLKYETVYCDITKSGYFLGVYPSDEVVSQANAKKDYFDKNLNMISLQDVKYMLGARGSNRLQYANLAGKKGYLDLNYKVAIPAKYDRVSFFSEGLAWVKE